MKIKKNFHRTWRQSRLFRTTEPWKNSQNCLKPFKTNQKLSRPLEPFRDQKKLTGQAKKLSHSESSRTFGAMVADPNQSVPHDFFRIEKIMAPNRILDKTHYFYLILIKNRFNFYNLFFGKFCLWQTWFSTRKSKIQGNL